MGNPLATRSARQCLTQIRPWPERQRGDGVFMTLVANRTTFIGLAVACLVAATACDQQSPTLPTTQPPIVPTPVSDPVIARLIIDMPPLVHLGDAPTKAIARVLFADGSTGDLPSSHCVPTWSSSSPEVAGVADGIVDVKEVGDVVIRRPLRRRATRRKQPEGAAQAYGYCSRALREHTEGKRTSAGCRYVGRRDHSAHRPKWPIHAVGQGTGSRVGGQRARARDTTAADQRWRRWRALSTRSRDANHGMGRYFWAERGEWLTPKWRV